jgi:hypothetical protein
MKLNWTPPQIKAQKAVYRWSALHAVYVHEGAVMKNGTVLPARRWTDFAVAQTPVAQIMTDRCRAGQSVDFAFREMATDLDQAFTTAIESPIWDWPRTTQRSNGETVGSPRNIVDEGTLRDSQSLRFEVNYG